MESEKKFKEGIVSHARRLKTDLRIMLDGTYELEVYGGIKYNKNQLKLTMSDMWRYMNKLTDSLREIEKVIDNEKPETDNH